MQYSVRACSAMAKDSFAQSIGAEWVQLSILAGVIVFNNSVAASPASSPTALSTRHVSQAECRLALHSPVTSTLFPPRSSSNETCRGWWISPTQCPRNFNDASFCAWLALLDDRTSKSFLIAVTTHADAPGQLSEWRPSESLGRVSEGSLRLWRG